MRKIAQYSIIRPLGKGQFGTVFLAVGNVPTRIHRVDTKRRVVALKKLHDLHDARSSALLLQEFHLLQQVKHRCIMQVYQYLKEDKTLVMEYVHGVTLRDVLDDLYQKKIRFPAKAAIEIGCEIADALFQAYTSYGENSEQLHLVHRDLKPANIMLTPNGEIKILDFGLARVTNSEFSVARNDQIQGTPIYMAPEQAQGMSIDHRTDLFSLGLILYELLMGEPAYPLPLGAVNPIQTILKDISAGKFTFTFEQLQHRLPSVGPILTKVLQHNPDARYRDGRDLQFDLRSRLSASSQQAPLEQFAQYYFQAIRSIERQPTYEELEAALNGLHRAPTLNEALRNSNQNQLIPNTNRMGEVMSKTPRKPPRRTPPSGKQEEYIIPRAVNEETESEVGLDGDATSFIAITPQVAQPPSRPAYTPPPPDIQTPRPPPPTIPQANAPRIMPGGQAHSYPTNQPSRGGIYAGNSTQQYSPPPVTPNTDVVQNTAVSGSMRVPILLLSAVACVCLAALAVIYLMPAPELTEPPEIEEKTRTYVEDPEPDDEVVAVAEEVKPVKTKPRRRKPAAPAKPKTGSLSVKIESSSDRVTNINLTCGSYFKKQNVTGGVARFTNIPVTSCKLKFNPGGAIYSGQVVGQTLSCSISNGNNVRCSK